MYNNGTSLVIRKGSLIFHIRALLYSMHLCTETRQMKCTQIRIYCTEIFAN